MLRGVYPDDSVSKIVTGIASGILGSKSGKPDLSHYVGTLQMGDVQRLVSLIDANRVTVPVYDSLNSLDSSKAQALKRGLEPMVLRNEELRRDRDELLGRLSRVLDDAGIDYAVFKTLNWLSHVGVDIDVIVDPSSYDECVEALLAKGFLPIDDLSKRYATGFMVRGNPIVVDLHTELAVLGVRYMSSDSLLGRSRVIGFQPCCASESFPLRVLDGAMDGLVRMVHCVVKEGMITIGDVAETLRLFPSGLELIVGYVEDEDLQLAASVFSYIALHMLGAEPYGRLIRFEESFTHNLARSIIDSNGGSIPPFRLPAAVCILALMDHVRRRGEFGRCVPSLVGSFRFRRSTAHLGKKICESFL